jgi:hypothetical protein
MLGNSIGECISETPSVKQATYVQKTMDVGEQKGRRAIAGVIHSFAQ